LAERLEAAESQLRALASVFGAAELLGERPTDGPGLSYLRARVDAVDRGEWGERKIEKYLAKMAADRRQPVLDPAEREKARFQAVLYSEMQRMGAHLLTRGMGGGILKVEWDRDPSDPHGTKRYAEAKRRAEAALAASKNGGAK